MRLRFELALMLTTRVCIGLAGLSLTDQLAGLKKTLAADQAGLKQELAEVKNILSNMLAEQEERPLSFSKVGSTVAEGVLQELKIMEVDGHKDDPIDLSNGVECTSFDLSFYPSENAGTPDLMKHHEEQLSACGIPFGKGGYAIYDVRANQSCLRFKSSSQVFRGTTDCTLAPYGLRGASCAISMRVGFEHKQSHKQAETTTVSPPSAASWCFSCGGVVGVVV
jgi:hypothetical protein